MVSCGYYRNSETPRQAVLAFYVRHSECHNAQNDRMQTAGQRIRAARELAGFLNQGDFAKAVGCSQSTLSEIENGETKLPSAKVLQKMAEVLGKSERWIIYGEDGGIETPTAEEQQMLSAFRVLPDDVRRHLAETIKTLARKT